MPRIFTGVVLSDIITTDKLGSIAGLTQERLEKMTPDEIYDMRVGSILHFFAWLAGFTTIWLLKVAGLPQQQRIFLLLLMLYWWPVN